MFSSRVASLKQKNEIRSLNFEVNRPGILLTAACFVTAMNTMKIGGRIYMFCIIKIVTNSVDVLEMVDGCFVEWF